MGSCQIHYLVAIWFRLQLGNWGSNRLLLAVQVAQENGWARWAWGIMAALFPCVMALPVRRCCSHSPFGKEGPFWKRGERDWSWERQFLGQPWEGNCMASFGKDIHLPALEKAIPWSVLSWKRQFPGKSWKRHVKNILGKLRRDWRHASARSLRSQDPREA